MTGFVLASGSAIRATVLRQAGLTFETVRPMVDEEAAKASLRAAGLTPRDQADALAELKALSVSRRRPDLVLGADQMLSLDGEAFDKPADRAAARAQLLRLRGRTHQLICAMVIARDGAPIWRHVETPKLTVRNFSETFLDAYLDQEGEAVTASVGAYQLEGRGAQLFSRIEGDYFSILGVALLPLLAFLRQHGIAPT